MRAFLKALPEGVPLDTVLARISGRRAGMITDWERLLLAPEPLAGIPLAPWRPIIAGSSEERKALQREYAWLFGQLTEPLRERMAPVFWLQELRILTCCLRLYAKDRSGALALLQESLLSERLQRLLMEAPDRVAAIRHLARVLSARSSAFADLPEIFRLGGDGTLDAALHDLSLTHLVKVSVDPVIRRYLTLLIDSSNLLAVAGQLHWRLAATPRLLAGGTIRPSLLATLGERQDEAALAGLAARLGGDSQSGGDNDIPRAVLLAQGRFLRELSREPTGTGALLNHLWRCSSEVRNLGLLTNLATAGSDLIAAELLS